MSLATRCPSCGTIFRVVQDQLKVSEGWVRCGQCHEVFHGIESLFDLESDPALTARRAARQAATSAPAVAAARQAQSERAAFVSAPTVPMPLAPTPSARAATPPPVASPPPLPPPPPPPPPSIASPAPELAGDPGLASGFAPAAAPATPRGMAPRFAARWAEAARERAARQAQSTSPLQETRPTFAGTPAPTPSIATAISATNPDVAPAGEPQAPETEEARIEAPPSFDAPTQPMGLDPDDREHVDIALIDEPPIDPDMAEPSGTHAAAERPEPRTVEPVPDLPPLEGALDDEVAVAAARAAAFAAPQVEEAAEPALPAARGPDANVEDEEDDEAAGPPTLASMLPESVAEWPPRARRGRRLAASRSREAGAAPDAAPALESERERAHPRFVREARRDERWNRPWLRASLGATLAVLVVAAVGQATWPWRDTIASRWPETAPLWQLACEQLDCTIEAPRSIASLTLDGSSLTRTEVDHVLLFSADLHNRSDHEVRMPSFDLSFMDLNGQVVARKVLDPAQIGIRQVALGPEGELHVHARIQVAGLEASGFQAEMFYP